MAERKGLFGRLFGKKSKAEEEATTEPPAEDQSEDSGPVDEDYAPRTEAEEMEDLDAAHSTAPDDGEAVVLIPREEEAQAPTPSDPPPYPLEEEFSDDPVESDHAEEARQPEAPLPDTLEVPEAVQPEQTETPSADLSETQEDTQATPAQEAEPEPEPTPAPTRKRGLFGRLRDGLSKTSAKLSGGITGIFTQRKLDDDTLEELEDLLITADLGIPATTRIITALSKSKYDQHISDEEVRHVLAEEVAATLKPLEKPLMISPAHQPHVILMTGVNGAGKTTTIGKLAKKFTDEGHSVLLAAGDTFRAAAIEQLSVWGERVGVPVVAKETGADAAGLAFDAIKRAQDENIDVVMIDTAGRLQNRKELMEELSKIVRVIKKLSPEAPHDTILILDATVGQNALSQTESFLQTAAVSGLIMTKLDGTARGGVLVALGDKYALPIHYIGVGEAVEDLQPFDADEFANALTASEG